MTQPDIEKKKGKRRRSLRAYVNANKPLAVPLDEIAAEFPPDDDDDGPARRRAKELGVANPVEESQKATGNPVDPMRPVGPNELARGHPNMRMGTTDPFPLGMMRTYNGDNQYGDRDITLGGGRVSLQRLDAYTAAGAPAFREHPSGNPVGRRMDHIAPINATGPNGGHSLSQPEVPARQSMKASDRVAIMREAMFGSGGAR